MSQAAHAAGVRTGMRRGGVLSLMPHGDFRERDPALEAAALSGLAYALMQYSPQVACASENTLQVDVSASLLLFGGIRALRQRVRATLSACGLTARLSLAPTGQGVTLLAHAGIRSALRLSSPPVAAAAQSAAPGSSPAPALSRVSSSRKPPRRTLDSCLSRLPVLALPAARPFADWFAGLGCRTLGDLRKLPRAGLKRRCGEALLDVLDQALGQLAEGFDWIVPPERFECRQELPDRVEQTHAVLATATGLVAQLTGWLTVRQLAVTRVVLWLEHERGRQAMPPTSIVVSLAEPTWQDKHLMRLLTERLAQTTLPAAVIAVRLEAATTEPARPPSASLFPDAGANTSTHHRLIELLTARLGMDNVLHVAPIEDHRPEVANRWQCESVDPAASASARRTQPTSASAMPRVPTRQRGEASASLPTPVAATLAGDSRSEPPGASRPVWLLASPIPLLIRAHRPFYGSTLRLVSAGERIESGWWDTAGVSRDYFVAEASDHSCYWIFRERPSSSQADDVRWYLHGLFG